jgi:hypothetical protein
VDTEIQRYKTLRRWWPYDKDTRDLVECTGIQWWCGRGQQFFPILSRVALAVFGLLPGSRALECDIRGFKDVIGPKRSRLDPAAVEMHLVVDKNKDLAEIDPGKLEQVPKVNWERMYPSRPQNPVDYYEGEKRESIPDNHPLVLSYFFDPNEEVDYFL